ncbi:MAG TPA: 2-dehydropantoate 2-reductase [Methanothrix sp.]|nr:2-dehydropantoate 2-reductase [Methanothrix sp.]HPC90403.1 2-dehydropantoate 2-reductase [Methanothrix sp.]HQI68917.1 2-dehydropantoate 2-reductase [Methanothrix sp.]HRS84748.1 2-dehydropantoate 2-reductase [Methanothrix sp.]
MIDGSSPGYLIYGAGAIGSVLGGFLQEAGAAVTFHGRGGHFRAMQESGLHITGIWGEHHIPAGEISVLDPSAAGAFSMILLCVKARDTLEAAAQAAPLLTDDGIMLSMQNGLNNWESIAGQVGQHRTAGSRVIFGSEIVEPGHVRVTVNADDVLLGEPFSPANRPLLKRLEADLLKSGIPARVVGRDEIWAAIWGKVLYNCSLNPLGALLGVPYGRLGESEHTRGIIRHVIEEIFLVMQARDVSVPYRDADDYYHFLLDRQLPPTAEHRASMLQDITAGRMTEIDALNGAISRYGRELSISTPYNDLLTALIKFKERA